MRAVRYPDDPFALHLRTLLANRIGLGPDVQASFPFTFERYDGGGLPAGVQGDAIPIQMRVAQVAEMAEVHHRAYGVDGARAMVRTRRGGQFDPQVADTFLEQRRRHPGRSAHRRCVGGRVTRGTGSSRAPR